MTYFSALVESGIVNPNTQSNFDLARRLQCTPTKASNLVFNYRLRSVATDDEKTVQKKLANATAIAKDLKNSDDNLVTLNVEDKFWRNELINRMKQLNVFTDTSFNRERLVLDASIFIEYCVELFGEDGRAIEKIIKESMKDPNLFGKGIRRLTGDAMTGTAKGAATATIAHLAS